MGGLPLPSSCCLGGQLNYFGTRAQLVQVVRPPLHHLAPCWQVGGAVVGAAMHITYRVRQLVLYQVHPLAQNLVQDGACVARNPWALCTSLA